MATMDADRVRAYWPEENGEAAVLPQEITDEQKQAQPECRPGWHVPDLDLIACEVCARPITDRDYLCHLDIPPGALPGLLRVIAAGTKALGGVAPDANTVGDLSIAASVMGMLLREQKSRAT